MNAFAPTRFGRSSPSRLWFGLSPASKRLITIGVAMLLIMVAAVSFMMWEMRKAALDAAHQNTGKLGIAIAEQTARSVQAIDLELQQLVRDVESRGIDTPERFTAEMRTQAVFETLRRVADALPQANAFSMVDANGKLLISSIAYPIPGLDLSDRDYFQYFRTHNDPTVFVSRRVVNRTNGVWTTFMVRRASGPSGNFLGVVVSAIDFSYFQDFFKALTAGAGTNVTLMERNGTTLTSYPATSRIGEVLPTSSPWHAIVARQQPDSYVADRAHASGGRIVSVHPLVNYPLVVDVSVTEWDVLAVWRESAYLAAFGTASAVLCVIMVLRALTLQLQRLERSETSLEDQNARLESQTRRLQTSQEHLAQKSTALQTTLGNMNQGIMMVDTNGAIAVCNARAIEMLELPPGLMASCPSFTDIILYQHKQREFGDANTPNAAVLAELPSKPSLYERTRPNGRIIEVQSVPLMEGGMVRTYTDITERRESEEKVRYFAHHDDLTRLVNRVVFQERLNHAVQLADRSHRGVAVLYLDLDRFKLINDNRGHSVGDQLLIEVAARLRGAVRDIDTVARMGGDEFAIILPLVDQPNSAAKLAERLLDLIHQPFEIEGAVCRVGVSIGMAMYPNHAANTGELVRNADLALYRAKTDGRGVFCMFDPAMGARRQETFALEQELQRALDLDEFEIDYQPIVDSSSRNVLSFEALLRWRHPQRGLVPPGDFIELAEQSGLIIPIGHWVLETACREAASWPQNIQVSVNLSPLQFNQESLTDQLTSILGRTGLAPARLVLEVTEGLLLHKTEAVLGTMSRLHALGVGFSLDDFGTAHAGLSYLRNFPFDTIKIDKSFVQDMEQPGSRAIVAAVLGMGAALDMGVIAEGVETEEQLVVLRGMNCMKVQGYLTGRPQSAREARKYIERSYAVLA